MSYIGRKRDPPSCISDEVVAHLVDALRELPPQESDEVAQAVALLWSSLIFHFRGLDGFVVANTDTKVAYLAQLTSCSSRLVRYGPSGKGHYFVAVASFTAYLLGWLGPRSEVSALSGPA